MVFSLDSANNKRLLRNIEPHDIIVYGSDRIETDIYVVFSVEHEPSIPALLIQLWKFQGGYDHTFLNVMESDLGLNKNVEYFVPQIEEVRITKIISYRPESSGLSEKEETYFNIWPKSESSNPTDLHSVPFRARVQIHGENKEIVIPSWTPLQRLPVRRIKLGTIIEVWIINTLVTAMKIIEL